MNVILRIVNFSLPASSGRLLIRPILYGIYENSLLYCSLSMLSIFWGKSVILITDNYRQQPTATDNLLTTTDKYDNCAEVGALFTTVLI